jgi:hypothetical protein
MDGSEYNNLLRYLTKKNIMKSLQLMKRGHLSIHLYTNISIKLIEFFCKNVNVIYICIDLLDFYYVPCLHKLKYSGIKFLFYLIPFILSKGYNLCATIIHLRYYIREMLS